MLETFRVLLTPFSTSFVSIFFTFFNENNFLFFLFLFFVLLAALFVFIPSYPIPADCSDIYMFL